MEFLNIFNVISIYYKFSVSSTVIVPVIGHITNNITDKIQEILV